MAAFEHTRPRQTGDGIVAIFSRFYGIFAHWAEARQTREALYRLSDRELDDIGLTRGEIEQVSQGHYRR